MITCSTRFKRALSAEPRTLSNCFGTCDCQFGDNCVGCELPLALAHVRSRIQHQIQIQFWIGLLRSGRQCLAMPDDRVNRVVCRGAAS
jgi:hypothetical protein